MSDKKYKLTNNTKEYFGRTLYQIEALISFGSIIKGDLGGYIEKEENLSQYGNAWVSGKLKLLAGFFFGVRYKKEEIKYAKVDDDYEVIYKGEAKFGEEENEKTEPDIIELNGIKYQKLV